MKTLLILVDGMRPDALANTKNAQQILARSAVSLDTHTVMPSVTLPCHMSLFHSVAPDRHGTTTNTYAPQVRPIKGLCEVLAEKGKTCAFFYNWEELRDLSRPESLVTSYYYSAKKLGFDKSNHVVTDMAIRCLEEDAPDFTFLYLGALDEIGHQHGWMTQPYMDSMESSWLDIQRILEHLPEPCTVIITADHGGHGRSHGTAMTEDMLIPLVITGAGVPESLDLSGATILDIAPTITHLMGIDPDPEWEGHSLV